MGYILNHNRYKRYGGLSAVSSIEVSKMKKEWGALSDEKIGLIVKTLAACKDWTSLRNAVKETIGSRTTLNVYLQRLRERGTIIRSVDEKRRVTYRLADPRQQALAEKSKSIEMEGTEWPQILKGLKYQIIDGFTKMDKNLIQDQETFVSIPEEVAAIFKREPGAKFMKPTREWAKSTVYHEALAVPYFYYILVDTYLDALMAKDKEIASMQWNEEFVELIFEIRKRFHYIFGIPIRAGLLKEEHVREAIYEWIHEYRTRTKYGEPFRYSKFDPTKFERHPWEKPMPKGRPHRRVSRRKPVHFI